MLIFALLTLLAVLLSVDSFGRAHARVVWGDTHAHSGLSNDGGGEPRDFFRGARDSALLDFVVLSDHDIHLTPEEVVTLNQAAAEFDEPGRFVAFPGTEWTHAWHMNFYFRDPDNMICGGGGGPPCDQAAEVRSFYASRVLAGEAASQVNHPHPLTPVQWWKMRDDISTNVEIYNTLWNRTVGPDTNELWFGGPLWALRVGFRLGFVAASDDHTLDDLWNFVGSGLTGCHVENLTRSDIIDALRNRRCYASNGNRTLLDFDVDGTPMGGERSVPIGSIVTPHVSLTAGSTPTSIELVLNGNVVAHKDDCAGNTCSFSAPVRIDNEYNFIYAKVRLGATDRTWSSPVWIHGTCNSPADCPAERFVPGMGPASTRCLAAWRVLPEVDRNSLDRPRRRATCVTGDPKCDADFNPSSCTFLVSLCTGVDPGQQSSCSFAPAQAMSLTTIGAQPDNFYDVRNERTVTAAAQALLSAEAPGRCGPYVPVVVPLRQYASGSLHRAARTFILRSETGGSRDRDRLTLLCEPG